MTVSAKCECGYTLRAADEYAGKRAKCPKCGKGVNLPQVEATSITTQASEGSISFATWQPSDSAEETFAAPPSPLPRLAPTAPPITSEYSRPLDDHGLYHQFFGLWVCQLAYRIVAWLWVAGSVVLTLLTVGVVLVGYFAAASTDGRAGMATGSLLGAMSLFWLAPVWLGTCIGAGGLLATAELLTAFGWWFYRQRIGGNGPF